MKIRFCLTALIVSLAPIAQAQSLPTECVFKPEDPTSCVRFVGCVNNGEAHFFGRAHGWNSGPLDGVNSAGATCAGEWTYDERIKQGKGAMQCADGPKAGFSFFSRSGKVSTLTGVTISENGDRMSLWTGGGLLEFFAEKYPDQSEPGFKCGDTWVPFPAAFTKETAED